MFNGKIVEISSDEESLPDTERMIPDLIDLTEMEMTGSLIVAPCSSTTSGSNGSTKTEIIDLTTLTDSGIYETAGGVLTEKTLSSDESDDDHDDVSGFDLDLKRVMIDSGESTDDDFDEYDDEDDDFDGEFDKESSRHPEWKDSERSTPDVAVKQGTLGQGDADDIIKPGNNGNMDGDKMGATSADTEESRKKFLQSEAKALEAKWERDGYLCKDFDSAERVVWLGMNAWEAFQAIAKEEKEREKAEREAKSMKKQQGLATTRVTRQSSGGSNRNSNRRVASPRRPTTASILRRNEKLRKKAKQESSQRWTDPTNEMEKTSNSAKKKQSKVECEREVDSASEKSQECVNKEMLVPDLAVGRVSDDVYEVRAIVDGRIDRSENDANMYMVEWAGWPSSYNSWITMEDIGSPELIRDFLEIEATTLLQRENENRHSPIAELDAKFDYNNNLVEIGIPPSDYYMVLD